MKNYEIWLNFWLATMLREFGSFTGRLRFLAFFQKKRWIDLEDFRASFFLLQCEAVVHNMTRDFANDSIFTCGLLMQPAIKLYEFISGNSVGTTLGNYQEALPGLLLLSSFICEANAKPFLHSYTTGPCFRLVLCDPVVLYSGEMTIHLFEQINTIRDSSNCLWYSTEFIVSGVDPTEHTVHASGLEIFTGPSAVHCYMNITHVTMPSPLLQNDDSLMFNDYRSQLYHKFLYPTALSLIVECCRNTAQTNIARPSFGAGYGMMQRFHLLRRSTKTLSFAQISGGIEIAVVRRERIALHIAITSNLRMPSEPTCSASSRNRWIFHCLWTAVLNCGYQLGQ